MLLRFGFPPLCGMQAHQCFCNLAFFLATFIISNQSNSPSTSRPSNMCIPPFVNWWPLPTIKKQTQCVPLLHKGISGICSNPTIPSRTSWTLPPDSVRLNIVGGFAWKWALVFLVRLSCAISYWEAYEYAAWLVPPFHTISSAFIYCLAQKKKSSLSPSNPVNEIPLSLGSIVRLPARHQASIPPRLPISELEFTSEQRAVVRIQVPLKSQRIPTTKILLFARECTKRREVLSTLSYVCKKFNVFSELKCLALIAKRQAPPIDILLPRRYHISVLQLTWMWLLLQWWSFYVHYLLIGNVFPLYFWLALPDSLSNSSVRLPLLLYV